MSETPAPAFTGGRNVAIKVPEHAFEATVAFYRDTLGLAMVYDAVGTKAFEFGPLRLWIDRMPHLAQGEMWLELVASDTAAAAEHLAASGVVRCNEVERLPPDLDGFWILNPAGIVHLVCSPEAEELAPAANAGEDLVRS
jgi:catechol 2,3-dioxygenase-like lactoylglutathione lyase family enzyme